MCGRTQVGHAANMFRSTHLVFELSSSRPVGMGIQNPPDCFGVALQQLTIDQKRSKVKLHASLRPENNYNNP